MGWRRQASGKLVSVSIANCCVQNGSKEKVGTELILEDKKKSKHFRVL